MTCVVLSSFHLFTWTVADNIRYSLGLYGKKLLNEKVVEYLGLADLETSLEPDPPAVCPSGKGCWDNEPSNHPITHWSVEFSSWILLLKTFQFNELDSSIVNVLFMCWFWNALQHHAMDESELLSKVSKGIFVFFYFRHNIWSCESSLFFSFVALKQYSVVFLNVPHHYSYGFYMHYYRLSL